METIAGVLLVGLGLWLVLWPEHYIRYRRPRWFGPYSPSAGTLTVHRAAGVLLVAFGFLAFLRPPF